MEVSKRFYIKSSDPVKRLSNLKKLADRFYRGNFSEMVNESLNEKFNLDPDTGEPQDKKLKDYMVAEPPAPPWPIVKKKKK